VDAGDSLTYSATLADGTALPSWLSFNAITRTFSGTPLNSNVGTITVKVTAKDTSNATVSTNFNLVVNNVNDVPIVNQPIQGNSQFSFNPVSNFPVGGTFPQSVKGGDFNEDGKLDLVLVSFSSNNVSILLGNGTGSFGTSTNFAVGNTPVSVNVGDFNKDNHLDIVATNSNENNVSVLLGNGNGSFNSQTKFAVGNRPYSVTVGDFNKDGNLDLAVANDSSNNVSVLLGNGNGSFATATNFTVGTTPTSIQVGDFNKDGNLDLVTANINAGGSVSILLGNGLGAFTTTNITVQSPFAVAVGDFNGDNKLDLATANQNANNIAVLMGNGTGGFSNPTYLAVGNGPESITVNDFNNDGKLDLAVTNQYSHNVSVLLGDGTGTFANPTTFAVGTSPTDITTGDFNGDNKVDLAISAQSNNQVSILLNNSYNSLIATEDSAFSFTFDANTFSDPDTGDTLTYSATLADGSVLPDWLSFNANTRTFSGTPLNSNVGSIVVKVTATDTSNAFVSTTFDLTVENTNDAPTVANAIDDRTIAINSPFSYTFDATTFNDADGDTLTYTATLANNSLLSNIGLTFNSATRTFSGTPNTTGNYEIKLTADDGFGGTVDEIFQLNIVNPTIGTSANNSFRGTNSHDFIEGLAGNDTFLSSEGNDRINGGEGIDYMYYHNSPVEVIVNLATGLGSGGYAQGDFLDSVEKIRGSNYDDRLIGNNVTNYFYGQNGNDRLEAGTGGGYFYGEGGNDTLIGHNNRDYLYGQEGDDVISGGNGDDVLVGWTGNDTLKGDGGNDYLSGDAGIDTITGADLTTLGVGEIDTIYGGADADIIKLGNSSSSFYDDGIAGNGITDYARIMDFDVNVDTIELFAGKTYFLGANPSGIQPGTGIYIDSDSSGSLNTSVDELIGLLDRTTLSYGQITGTTQGFRLVS
jgi:Ca2+-binding RTX toxin-like protein